MLEDVLKSKIALFEEGKQTVLRGQENRYRRIVIRQGNLVVNERSEESGICAKVYHNGVNGFASIAEYSKEAAEKVLRAATENADYLHKYAKNSKAALPGVSKNRMESKRFIIDFEQKKIIDVCRQLDDYIAGKYPKLASRAVMYREDTMEKIIYTSDASCGHVAYPRCS
ncbi:MAG: TldD/PmbA family protein, partial [Acetatifactor sp.]|nr:TldD/PmbA family protein [Acetatifactor sp.]